LYTLDNVEVGDVSSLIDRGEYFFKAHVVLVPESGSNWSEAQLLALKVKFVSIAQNETFLPYDVSLSVSAAQLIAELGALNHGTID
jgi:hypothetical protein